MAAVAAFFFSTGGAKKVLVTKSHGIVISLTEINELTDWEVFRTVDGSRSFVYIE